jgi:hypothetical protein
VRYLVGALLLGLCLAASGCGGERSIATTTVITVSGTYRYPQGVITSFMRLRDRQAFVHGVDS